MFKAQLRYGTFLKVYGTTVQTPASLRTIQKVKKKEINKKKKKREKNKKGVEEKRIKFVDYNLRKGKLIKEKRKKENKEGKKEEEKKISRFSQISRGGVCEEAISNGDRVERDVK